MTVRGESRTRQVSTLAVGAVAVAVVTAACGSSSSAGSTTTTHTGVTSNLGFPTGTVTGVVRAVSADAVTVTTPAGSADVKFSSATRFSRVTTTARSAVVAGDCLSVQPSKSSPTTITASVVTITGTSACPAPTLQPQGNQPGTAAPGGSAPPGELQPGGGIVGGSPSSPPPDVAGRGGPLDAPLRGAFGTVRTSAGDSIVLAPAGPEGLAPITVTVTQATTYQVRTAVDRSDVKAGVCLSAFGTKPGQVLDASLVAIADPVDGKCDATLHSLGAIG
ncbi:MAG: hypothetical protein JO246_06770 [Frankiaceae bacterium]|nr:hypothetical protein [Frankiaceae bacterium]MBV9869193.1 hypothetical protein [Frankiaceae bacterium]